MSSVTLNNEQYTALTALARRGCTNVEQTRTLESFLKEIDKTNGVTRFVLLVQWQELDSPIPPNAVFPEKWPPELRLLMERVDRPIAKADVTTAVAKHAKNPHEVIVTRDVGGLVGWTKLDDFFIT